MECWVQEVFISRMMWSAGFKRPAESGELIGVDDDPAAEKRKPGIEHGFRDREIGGIGSLEVGGQTSNDSTACGCS